MALADAMRDAAANRSSRRHTRRCIWTGCGSRFATESRICARAGSAPRRFWFRALEGCSKISPRRGLRLYLASGTDDANVKEEAALLGVASFFEDRIFGAQDDLSSFSKAILVGKSSRVPVSRPMNFSFSATAMWRSKKSRKPAASPSESPLPSRVSRNRRMETRAPHQRGGRLYRPQLHSARRIDRHPLS